MARWCDLDTDGALAGAQYWRDRCLTRDGSVFGEDELWTAANLAALRKHYSERLDFGTGSFVEKFEVQMVDAPPETKKLAAECLWVLFLFPCRGNIGGPRKREMIQTVWAWSGEELDSNHPMLHDALDIGIANPGRNYGVRRWAELVFLIEVSERFKGLPAADRQALAMDPWKFAAWLDEIKPAENPQLRHILRYLLFPDDFERIATSKDKLAIVRAFEPNGDVAADTPITELDRRLLAIRQREERERGTRELDFYHPPLREGWLDEPLPNNIERDHILDALRDIRREGIPASAQSSTYDVIYEAERFPPKLVVSIANRYANGTELDRDQFKGGEGTWCFEVLRAAGFSVERKDFIESLVRRFVQQANAGESLAVADYPREYRGHKLIVSFGKGNYSRVPWIAITDYGQHVKRGINPVILYYKAIGLLVLGYGVSEEEPPTAAWELPPNAKTLEEHVRDEYGYDAERYGSSFFHSAYRVDGEMDFSALTTGLDEIVSAYERLFADAGKTHEPESPPYEPTDDTDEPFTLVDAMQDLFISAESFERILQLWGRKKNVILQGPPGVGKSFFAERLAFALMGSRASERLRTVQFHQSYAYEDFVQGYRPSAAGFERVDGVFYRFCSAAAATPDDRFVFVIDEINRGNLSKIFGELMVLIEPDKRGERWAIPLQYSSETDAPFYVPPNLYLLGLMNTADRSLAMVDYALRRRFGFVDLEPQIESPRIRTFLTARGASAELVNRLVTGLSALNRAIAADKINLGPGFQIGHSYFVPLDDDEDLTDAWFEDIVESEIAPLLREYWFDDPEQAQNWIDRL